MPNIKDIFKTAAALRDQLTEEQSKHIQQMYVDLAKKIEKQSKDPKYSVNPSGALEQQYLSELKKQVEAWSHELSNGLYTSTQSTMNKISDAVVSDNVEWLSSLGIGSKKGIAAAFSNVNQSVVNAIMTGSVYGGPGSWSLSKSIWSDNEKNLQKIYSLIAEGYAAQMPVCDIADMISKYVDPTKKLDWTGPNGNRIYGHKVDYNAQRLVRTLSQHTYQQSIVQCTQDNPFITGFVWIANGSRVCDLCKKRDGKFFKKDQLPLDHPNGMCVMRPAIKKTMTQDLAGWVKGTNKDPAIDAFAKKLGYDPDAGAMLTLGDIKQKYGDLAYGKKIGGFQAKLPKDVQAQLKKLKNDSGLSWDDFYTKNFDGAVSEKVKKKTLSDLAPDLAPKKKEAAKTLNKALDTLDDAADDVKKAKSLAKQLKEEAKKLKATKAGIQADIKELTGNSGNAISQMRKVMNAYEKKGQQGIMDFLEKNGGWDTYMKYSEGVMDIAKAHQEELRKMFPLLEKEFQKQGNKYTTGYLIKARKSLVYEYMEGSGKLTSEIDDAMNSLFKKLVGAGKHEVDIYDDLKTELKSLTDKINTLNKQAKVQEAIAKGVKKEVAGLDYSDAIKALKSKDKNYAYYEITHKSDAFTDALEDIMKKAKTDDIEKAFKMYSSGKIKSEKFDDFIDLAQDYIDGKVDFPEIPSPFSPEAYTEKAKKYAHDFDTRAPADRLLRPKLDELWDDLTDDEKFGVWQYTHNSHPVNRPLSGYDGAWNRSSFKGLGKVDLDNETLTNYDAILHSSDFKKKFANINGNRRRYSSVVQDLTSAIEKSEIEEGMYLYRGSDYNGLAGWFEGAGFNFDDMVELFKSGDDLSSLEGMVVKNHAFSSTAIANGSGFGGNVKYKIYAPSGTKGIYAEPQSYFGDTTGMHESIYEPGKKYSTVGSEAEIILQRGTSFRITSIRRNGSTINIELEVVDQPDYFVSGIESTYDGGISNLK